MARTRREFLALAALAGVAPALAACGSGVLPEPDVAAPGFGQDATGTLRLWTRSATQNGMRVVVDAFHASQDRIRVELTPVPDPQYVTKLATAIRARAVPDLVDIDDINAMLFIYRDAFTDLTDLIAALPYVDQLSPGHLALGTVEDRRYAAPFLADNSVLWYNTELLERAGVDPATGLTTLEGCVDAARAVGELGGGVSGWSLAANSPGIIGFVVQPHLWATGARNLSGEVGQQTGDIAGNTELEAVLQAYRSLWSEDLMPVANFTDTGSTWGADFRAGTVGLFPSSYGAVVPAADAAAVARTGNTLLPGPGGGTAFFDGGDNLCIPRGAANASAAWEFTTFALELEQQRTLPQGGYIPVRSDAADDAFRAEFPLAVPTLEAIEVGYAPTTLAYNLLFNQPNSPHFELFRRAVFDGEVEAAMAAAQTAFDRVLEQAQR